MSEWSVCAIALALWVPLIVKFGRWCRFYKDNRRRKANILESMAEIRKRIATTEEYREKEDSLDKQYFKQKAAEVLPEDNVKPESPGAIWGTIPFVEKTTDESNVRPRSYTINFMNTITKQYAQNELKLKAVPFIKKVLSPTFGAAGEFKGISISWCLRDAFAVHVEIYEGEYVQVKAFGRPPLFGHMIRKWVPGMIEESGVHFACDESISVLEVVVQLTDGVPRFVKGLLRIMRTLELREERLENRKLKGGAVPVKSVLDDAVDEESLNEVYNKIVAGLGGRHE